MASRQPVQHVLQTVQIDLGAERTEEYAIVLTDRDYEDQHRLVYRRVPERFADQRVTGSQVVQAVGRHAESRPTAAAREGLPVQPDDGESFVTRQVLTHGIEVVAEPVEGLRRIPAGGSCQIV